MLKTGRPHKIGTYDLSLKACTGDDIAMEANKKGHGKRGQRCLCLDCSTCWRWWMSVSLSSRVTVRRKTGRHPVDRYGRGTNLNHVLSIQHIKFILITKSRSYSLFSLTKFWLFWSAVEVIKGIPFTLLFQSILKLGKFFRKFPAQDLYGVNITVLFMPLQENIPGYLEHP